MNGKTKWLGWSGLIAVLILLVGLDSGAAAVPPVVFSRDILPILSDNCVKCRGPDETSRKAKLRFDLQDEALKPAKSGERAIVPGKPAESELIKRINAKDEDDLMPPVKSEKKLTPAQKEMFKRWISEGAKWGRHWAFEPPVRPEVPGVEKAPRSNLERSIDVQRARFSGLFDHVVPGTVRGDEPLSGSRRPQKKRPPGGQDKGPR